MTPARILMAEEESMSVLVAKALAGYEVLTVSTKKQAERLLIEDGIDLCVISINFDNSQTLSLIHFIRESDNHKFTPIVVTRFADSENARLLNSVARVMTKVQRINEYLELEGHDFVADKVRAGIEKHLPASKIMPR